MNEHNKIRSVNISFGILQVPIKDMINEEIEYKALKLLEANPDIFQRKLSSALGVSLGQAQYILQ